MPLTPRRIVLLGPQGSGKGTQAEELARFLSIPHVSTGEIFRRHIAHHTSLGRRITHVIDAGHLVPDRITNRVVATRLAQPDCARGFILDGYPRTIGQARFLERTFPPTLVFALSLDQRESVRRISGRRMAPDGKIYHLKFDPPPPALRKHLIIRHDDLPSVVRRRLGIYQKHTGPLIEFYDEQSILQRVNAKPPIAVITRQLVGLIRKWTKRNIRGEL